MAGRPDGNDDHAPAEHDGPRNPQGTRLLTLPGTPSEPILWRISKAFGLAGPRVGFTTKADLMEMEDRLIERMDERLDAVDADLKAIRAHLGVPDDA